MPGRLLAMVCIRDNAIRVHGKTFALYRLARLPLERILFWLTPCETAG
jgi:hypothetical protein